MSESLKFGYKKGLPPDVTTAWGCRAIVHDNGFALDIPPDREAGFGDWHTLCGYLRDRDGGEWIGRATAMFTTGELTVRSSTEVTLFEDDRAVIKANPQRSYGYLYVCAYFKPELPVDPQEIRRKIAAVFGHHRMKENPHSRVDYTEPDVVKLADITAADLVKAHNEGNDTYNVALLLEIADEEGWS